MAKVQSNSFALAFWLLVIIPAGAQDADPAAAKYDALISQLASNQFDEREAAATEVLEIGDPIRPWLLRGAGNSPLELQIRCKQLLKLVEDQSFERALEVFERGESQDKSLRLPYLSTFVALFGEDTKARSLYCQIARNEQRLLQMLAAHSDLSRELVSLPDSRRRARLTMSARRIEEHLELIAINSIDAGASFRVETYAACILIGCEDELIERKSISNAVFGFFRDPKGIVSLKKSPHFPRLRIGLEQWLAQSKVKVQPLSIAIQLGLSELALKLGRNAVAAHEKVTPTFDNVDTKEAILGVIACGRFGDSTDIERLSPLLTKNVVIQSTFVNDDQAAFGQLRDLALAHSAHLAGVDAFRLGFPHLKPNSELVYVPQSVTFFDDASRESAHQAWKKLQSLKSKTTTMPPPGVSGGG
jgi:hypothetical protein